MFVVSAGICAEARAALTNRDPDWPCQAIEVPEIAPAAFWQGPPLDAYAKTWKQDPAVVALVDGIAPRRVSLDEAQQRIAQFAAQAGAQKQRSLLAIVAGLFDALNQERAAVIAGLDRFGRRQKQLAADLRTDVGQMHALQAAQTPDEAKLTEVSQRVTWEARVFEDRRRSLSFVCDVPNRIEQHLRRLTQMLQDAWH